MVFSVVKVITNGRRHGEHDNEAEIRIFSHFGGVIFGGSASIWYYIYDIRSYILLYVTRTKHFNKRTTKHKRSI